MAQASALQYTALAAGKLTTDILHSVLWVLSVHCKDHPVRIKVQSSSAHAAIRQIDTPTGELDSTEFRAFNAPDNCLEGVFQRSCWGGDSERVEIEVKGQDGVPDGNYDVSLPCIANFWFIFDKVPEVARDTSHRPHPLDE